MIAEVTLSESIQTWIVVIFIIVGVSLGAGALVYMFLKPLVEWVFEPLEEGSED